MRRTSKYRTALVRLAAVVGVAVTLGGCIVVPGGPGFYRPHPYHYYYY